MTIITEYENEPKVTVTDVEKITTATYGNASKIALIGAFPTATIRIKSYSDVNTAMNELIGTYTPTTIPQYCVSYDCLPYIFNQNKQSKGAEEIIIVNTCYGVTTFNQEAFTITNAKLADALLLLADENFDILTIADTFDLGTGENLNPIWSTLHSFVGDMYYRQKPFGIITSANLPAPTEVTGEALLNNFKELFSEKGIFKIITTPVKIKNDVDSLNLAQSACWHSAFTAGRNVNKSETAKEYQELVGEDTKSIYPPSTTAGVITWNKLMDNGFLTTKYKNRRLQQIVCVNNMTPAGWDMKIERVKNYLLKRMTLSQYLGEDNMPLTWASLKGLLEFEKNLAIQNLFITDLDYDVKAVSKDCVKVKLTLEIPDIIRKINMEVYVKVTDYEEA